MNFLISVIITTYKRSPELLKRAILSVIHQTYHDIEVLIVDDSPSTYEYRNRVEDMVYGFKDSRLKLIKHPKNLGVSAARNTGIKISKGNYIAFLDDDDEWLTEKLQKQIISMSDLDVGLVYCDRFIYNDDTNIKFLQKRIYSSGYVFDELIAGNFIGSPTFVLVRRDCFDKLGLFNEQMGYSEDFEMWLRIAKEYKISFIAEPLAIYHEHNKERATHDYSKIIKGKLELNRIYDNYLSNHKKIKSIRLLELAVCYSVVKDWKMALCVYITAIQLSPFRLKINIRYTIKIIFYFFI